MLETQIHRNSEKKKEKSVHWFTFLVSTIGQIWTKSKPGVWSLEPLPCVPINLQDPTDFGHHFHLYNWKNKDYLKIFGNVHCSYGAVKLAFQVCVKSLHKDIKRNEPQETASPGMSLLLMKKYYGQQNKQPNGWKVR